MNNAHRVISFFLNLKNLVFFIFFIALFPLFAQDLNSTDKTHRSNELWLHFHPVSTIFMFSPDYFLGYFRIEQRISPSRSVLIDPQVIICNTEAYNSVNDGAYYFEKHYPLKINYFGSRLGYRIYTKNEFFIQGSVSFGAGSTRMIIEGNKHHLFFMNTSVGGLSGIAKTWKSFFISTDIGLFLRYSSTKKRFSNSSEVLFLPIFESGFLPELNLNLGFKLF